ncbi:tetratricopeptide repeat protein [Chitinophaga sp. NPDC101104]|uniref:tetratricopeptide repeat protein n=1 Tax=Chitinophaga sp. NPDC101104 TaxID=3390561 RepID=UPI003CFBEE58
MDIKIILILIGLAIASGPVAGQTHAPNGGERTEVNYVRGVRPLPAGDVEILELGHHPRLCTLFVAGNPDHLQIQRVLKNGNENGGYSCNRLFSITFNPNGQLASMRPLTDAENEKYSDLQPIMALAVAAPSADEATLSGQFKKAQTLYDEGKSDAAITLLNNIISRNTQNPDYHFLKAKCLAKKEQHAQALREAAFALKMDPQNPELLHFIAVSAYFLKDYPKAAEYFEKAVQHDYVHSALPFHNYVRMLIEIPRPDRAIEIYQVWKHRVDLLWGTQGYQDPYTEDLDFYAAQAFELAHQFGTALFMYDELLVIDPLFYGYHAQRARVLMKKGEGIEALQSFHEALRLAPKEEKDALCGEAAQAYADYFRNKPANETLAFPCAPKPREH